MGSQGTAEPKLDTTLCECGHPRHKHVYCNEHFPALCTHADPVSADATIEEAERDSICWCLEFEAREVVRDAG